MYQNMLNNPVHEIVNVEMTPDKMLGIIWFSAPKNGGRTLSYEEVLQAIKLKGIVAGIHEADIREIVGQKNYNYKYVIAKGQAPQNGTDAKIDLKFDPEGLNKLRPRMNDDGTVDFKNLEGMKNVKKNEVLATKTPATEGIDGLNILGQKIKAKKGKDCRLPQGKNTKILEDGLTLVATEDGKLEYIDGKVSVSTILIIPGDVDSGTGNIDFLGSVVINGTVHSGFKIQAKGSVEVRGPVEGATIIADGDIILSYGVQGTEESRLEAGGNIVAKFIQNAFIQAEGDIITEGIWHSTVNAGGVVKVDMGKGCIIGGNISATNVVSARNIGSPMGALTDIQIGIQPCVYSEYKELTSALVKEQDELENIEKEIVYLKTRNIGVGSEEFRKTKLDRLMQQRKILMEQIEIDKKRYKNLTDRVSSVKEGVVEVYDKIYPGSKIVIGNTTKNIDRIQTKCKFEKKGEDISIDHIINSTSYSKVVEPRKAEINTNHIKGKGLFQFIRRKQM